MLVDGYGRVIDYLRVSVTDRCNLRCLYCFPPGEVRYISHDDLLRYEEILRLAKLFVGLGIRKIRVTGGEPLLRKNILFLLTRLQELEDLQEVSLTTNGLLLGENAAVLREIGMGRVNVSIDTLRSAVFKKLTGSDTLDRVIAGIREARGVGLQVKLNVVAMRGINHEEYPDFISFALNHGCDIRFIEIMPQTRFDRFASEQYISSGEILDALGSRYRLQPLSLEGGGVKERFFTVEGHPLRIGFISPISDPFCARCNRLRLMSDGTLKSCLFSRDGVNLKELLRRGCSEEEIEGAIIDAVKAKPKSHRIGCGNISLDMHRTGG
jgi:cyclic pyranopterin phosphate synthase